MIPPGAGRALRRVGWALLWGAAAAGALISAAAFLAALPATRPFVASTLIRWADEAVAGKVELEGIAVLPHGGVELRGLRVFDPEGALVLRVERARLFADAFGIAERELRVSAELDGVEVDAARRGDDGVPSIVRAFAPSRPARPRRPGGGPGEVREEGGSGWSLRVNRLAISRGRLLADAGGARPLEATDVTLAARGLWGPRDAWLEARASASLAAPVAAPASFALRAERQGDRVELQRFEVVMGTDRLEAVGEGELSRRSGRLAVTRLGVSGREAGALAPAARLGGELSGTFYAEADGGIATAALELAPEAGAGAGRARVAAATRLPPEARALGLVAEVDRLDPSRISLLAPPGRVTLTVRGGARGTRLADLSGRLALRLERSRLRGGELGPVELQATAGGGSVDVARLEAAAPGGSVGGQLRWHEGRAVSGKLEVRAGDLAALERNLAALLGRPMPRLEGSGRADVTLSGSSEVPRLEASVEAPRLGVGAIHAEGARLRVELQGPAEVFSGRVQGGLEQARVGGLELRGVRLEAALRDEEASLAFAASAPRLGTELVRAMLRGRFEPKRAAFDLADAAIAWPGSRFELVQPARIRVAVPGVDRLILASDAQRLELTGGVTPDGKLDGRLQIAGLDLARLPRGLAPPRAALAGLLTLDARASGTRAAPRVEATIGLAGASAYEVGGLQLLGDVTWDGELERLEADLGLVRERGGAIDVSIDLPAALGRARPYEEVRVELTGRAVPLDELVWLAGSYALVSGDVDVHAALRGSVGNPSVSAKVAVRDGTFDDLEGLGLDATVEASEDRLRASARASLAGAGAGDVEAELALDLAALLRRPSEAIADARRGALQLALHVPALGLAPLAGRLGLPADVAGKLDAEASLAGSLAAPRGTLRLALDDGAAWGARAVGGRIDLALAPERSGATLEVRLGGKPALRADASVDLPAERLLDRAALAAASVRADVVGPRSDLAAWGGELLALRGAVEGRASLRGTAAMPQAELSLSATDAFVEGRALGNVTIEGRYAANRASLRLDLQPPEGGPLRADAMLDRPFGVGSAAGPISASPAELRLRADGLDLGFLPALAPGLVRAASGAATVDLAASGALGELRPRGTLRVSKGRLALAELGDWTDAAIEASLGEDAIELTRFDVRKGTGTLSVRGVLRGLSHDGQPAQLEAKAVSKDFGIEHAGMELARFDLTAEARGELTRRGLTIGVVVPQAEVKLPKRIPRTLQGLEPRKDITVGRPRPARARRAAPAGPVAPAPTPFTTVVHFVAPRRFRVRADSPRLDVELKADAIFAFAGSREEATGTIEAIRGQAEPIGGRVFELERGKVTFNGGPIAAGALDVVARYDNPKARVQAALEGTLGKPKLRLTSEPPLEEAQIAMLIATGRTDVQAGENGVSTLAGGDAGLAAAGAVVTGVFKDLLSDKLPVDSVSLDSTAVSAGKYLTDRVYVGYVRRFDAKPEKGENPDEVRIEYQLAPGWQVETRYGSGQSGSASIVWTKNY